MNVVVKNTFQIVVSIFVLVSFIGCGSAPVRVNDYQRYKNAMQPKEGPPNYKVARESLEKIVYSPSSTEKMRASATRLLAYNLFSGAFGYYDEKNYVYWANTLGSNKGVNLKHKVLTIEKFRQLYPNNNRNITQIFNVARGHCQADSIIPKTLNPQSQNLALEYLNSIDCIATKLIDDTKLRKTYADHVSLLGTRENAKQMARGFELYADPRNENSQRLRGDDLSALLIAKLQAYTYAAKTKRPSFSHKNVYKGEEVLKIYRMLDSDNDSDWTHADKKIEAMFADPQMPVIGKARLSFYVYSKSIFKKRYQMYKKYRDILLETSVLDLEEERYIEKTSLVFLHGDKRYGEAAQIIDLAIDRLKAAMNPI